MNMNETVRQSNKTSHPTVLKSLSHNPSKSYRTVNGNDRDNIQHVSSQSKSNCTLSRLICIQLLILLFLLTLTAIIIPIVVIILDSRNSQSPCATTYSQSFTTLVTPTSQCTAWQIFKAGLTCPSYSAVRIYGSNDPIGVTASSSVATAIAVGLRFNTSITVISNGVTWRVGYCSGALELSATGTICSCPVGYTLRPCHVNPDWGGINTVTCSPPSQTMSLDFA